MKKTVLSFAEQINEEEKAIFTFIDFFATNKDFSKIIYEEWTAKDILGHVTSWHISFAKNLLDAVNNNKATPFKGSLTEVNEREVLIMSQFSVPEFIQMIKNAQEQIIQNIENKNVQKIAYK